MVEDRGYSVFDDYFVDWFKRTGNSIPRHVQQTLYELFLNASLDEPQDVLQYCYEFFRQLKRSKKITPFHADEISKDKDLEDILQTRRHSIYVPTVNPEDDITFYADEVVHPKPVEVKIHLSLSLRNVFLFRHLPSEDLMRIVNAMFSVEVRKDDMIIRQGDVGDYFYLIDRGTFTAFKEDQGTRRVLCIYYGSGSFGELALLYNAPRAASIQADTDGQLWAVDRDTFRRIVLKGAFEKRKLYSEILRKVPILSELETYDLMNIADAVIESVYTDGMWVFHEGDTADGMYFIVSGNVVIYKKDPECEERKVQIKQLEPGDYFGELGLILHKPRAAGVRASGTVKLAFLESIAFIRLIPPKCVKRMMEKFKAYDEELKQAFATFSGTFF